MTETDINAGTRRSNRPRTKASSKSKIRKFVVFVWSFEFFRNVLAGVLATYIATGIPLAILAINDGLASLPVLKILSRVIICLAALLYVVIAALATMVYVGQDAQSRGAQRVAVLALVWILGVGLTLLAVNSLIT